MSNSEFFNRFEGLTFDDVVVVPGYSDVLPDMVNTTTTFARDIELTVPLVSAAMDKVTEARLAIAIARNGGLGIIHRNLTIEDQATEVRRVKRSQSGMITDPVTLSPTATLAEAEQLMNRYHFGRTHYRQQWSSCWHFDQSRHSLLQAKRLHTLGHRVHDQHWLSHSF